MKNDDFNPEKKLQEWQNRPSKQRLLKKRRFSIFLLLINITIIILAYFVMSKSWNKTGYYSTKIISGNTEYRLSVTDNNETMDYGITLTVSGIDGVKRMFDADKDLSEITIMYQGTPVSSVKIINNASNIPAGDKPLIYNSRLDKRIIDMYLDVNGLLKKKKSSILDLKKNTYLIDAVIHVNNRSLPLRLSFEHEALR
jgi:hypothetical protein